MDRVGISSRGVQLIAAPSNLGLRPPEPGHEPGAWRAPEVLLTAGLASRVASTTVVEIPRPSYVFDLQPATRIRNGLTIRAHALELADAVEAALAAGRFALVVGGDCSILLGCLLGVRRLGRCGLVHVDGHRDFHHPGNYDTGSALGSAAGMDLALATGRGELLLTHWPGVGLPLVADADVIQMGDREVGPGSDRDTPLDPSIAQLSVQEMLALGIPDACARGVEHLERRSLDRVWLHVDLDVLDQRVLPSVDSPGSPGLDLPQLAELIMGLISTGRIVGLDATIYDPELDPRGEYPSGIVEALASGLSPLVDFAAGAA